MKVFACGATFIIFARPGSDNFIYSGQRNDQLLMIDGDFKIADREVIMDYANIDVPTLGLIFLVTITLRFAIR